MLNIDTFNSYPHLLHRKIKERFPFAVVNVIVTAIGGENSGLRDTFNAFRHYIKAHGDLSDLLSHVNHPNRKGHEIIASELAKWFIAKQ